MLFRNSRKHTREISSSSSDRPLTKHSRENVRRRLKHIQRATQIATTNKFFDAALEITDSSSSVTVDAAACAVHTKLDEIDSHMAQNDFRKAYQGFRLIADDVTLREAADKEACLRLVDLWRILGDEKRQNLQSLKVMNEWRRREMEMRSDLQMALQKIAALERQLRERKDYGL